MGFFSQPAAPSPVQEMSSILPMIEKYFPQMLAEQNAGTMGTAQANLAATQATSGPMAQLMNQLYAQYGPQLAQIGSQIGQQTQQNQAGANAVVANSAQGQAALQASIAADQAANPEYYATRSATSGALNTLLGQDTSALTSPLGPTVTRAIDQSVAQQNNQTGTVNVPSAAQTVSNAMQYGNAGYAKQEQAKTDLSTAIGNANNFLPTSQSQVGGMNAFNTATGGSSTATNTANNAESLFGGTNANNVNSASATAAAPMSSLLGSGTSLANTSASSNAAQSSPYQSITGFL